jgi:hypothetical protein
VRGEKERLTAAFRLQFDGKEIIGKEYLELNDGTISDKTIKRLRDCFPAWDGAIESLEAGECCRDVTVDIVIENEADKTDPSKTWSNVKFMNPPGGKGATLPAALDRKSLTAKYGAKFRALSGGTPPAAKPKAPPAPPPPAKAKGLTSTMEECWESLCKKFPEELREQVQERWFKLIEQSVPGKDQGDFTGDDWGKVAMAIELPF